MNHLKTEELHRSPIWACSFFAFILLLSLATTSSWAQDDSTPIDAASQGKGGAATTTPSTWSLFTNQGALGFYEHRSISINQENRFLLKELNISSIAATLPVKPGTIALGFSRFGYSLYNESRLMVGIGKRLWPKLSVGVGLGAHFLKIADGYGQSSAYSVEVGVVYSPAKKLMVAAHLFNPTAEKIGSNPSKSIASGISAGIGYSPTSETTLSFEVTQQ